MRCFVKYFCMLVLLLTSTVLYADGYGITQRFKSIQALEGQLFAICNEADGMAIYGSTAQNLAYGSLDEVIKSSTTGYYFKLEKSRVENGYLLRLYTLDNMPYTIWENPGYLNSQPADGSVCFILGLGTNNGQDGDNLAVWQFEEKNGKFALKNMGTGLYLKDNSCANYDTPTYFTFCTIGENGEEPNPDTEIVSTLISWNEVISAGSLTQTYSSPKGDGFTLTRIDRNDKHSVDQSNCNFGTSISYKQFTHRLKTGGKSSESNALSLSIPYDGVLNIYARSASGTDETRTIVLTQEGKELYNKIVKDNDAIYIDIASNASESNPTGSTKIYPVITVNVESGIVNIEYPVGGLNFYGFELSTSTSSEPSGITIEEAFANTPANCIPEGCILNFSGEIRTSDNGSYGSGPRMFEFADGGDFTKALYIREGYVEYGSVKGHELKLEQGKMYAISFNTAMWKEDGPKTLFQIFYENSGRAMLTKMIDNAPNVNGSFAAVTGSTFTTIHFTPQSTGNYRLRWTSTNSETDEPGFCEILLANPQVYQASIPWEDADVANGTYYLYNVATRKYLAAGNQWGTHAIVNNAGLDYIITNVNGKYTLDSQISNGDNSHYLNDVWNDSSLFPWNIYENEDSTFIISNGSGYLTAGDDGIVTVEAFVSYASKWKFVTLAERLEALNAATLEKGVDATFLIQGANFGRNDQRNQMWTVSNDCNTYTISGGNNHNNVSEFYHSTATISQVLSKAPAGNYMLTAQGFYRLDGNDKQLPFFFANNETQDFQLKTGSENSMSDASVSFTNGLYNIEPIFVTVENNGDLTIGIKNPYNKNSWGVFDNFQLVYYGTEGDFSQLKPVAVDMTNVLANADFEQGEQGWTKEAVAGGNVRAGGTDKNKCYEAWNNEAFDIYQTVESLPVGIYELSVQGFYRYLAKDNAYQAYMAGNVNVPVYIYINDNLTPFKNVFDEPVYSSGFYQSDDYGSYYYEGNYTGAYFPNSMQTTATAFSANMYQNNTFGAVFNDNEGMRIGVKGNSSAGDNSWAIWDNFKLIFWGKAPSKVALALTNAIAHANEVLKNQQLTKRGINMLQQSVNDATVAKDEYDGEAMFAALQNLYKATSDVLTNEVLEQEVFTFDNSASGQQVSTFTGKKTTLAFDKAQGSSVPSNYSGYIRVYNLNTLTVTSEENILDAAFSVYGSSYNVIGTADTGTLETNHWFGNANSFTLTNTGGSQWRINKITITLDNPTDSVLYDRLQKQLAITDSALVKLAYENIPGRVALQQLADSAHQVEMVEGVEKSYLKSLIKSLRMQTETVVLLDREYQQVAELITQLSIVITNNKYTDEVTKVEALAYNEEVLAGLADGKYMSADLSDIRTRLNYYISILREIYLTLYINEAGTLGDSILACVENFTDVIGLRISGNLNSDDMYNLKNRLTNVKYLDLAETDLYYIANDQFRDHTNLQSIVLPKSLMYINDYAFYGCTNLQSIKFPQTLQTIGDYAFYNCSLENVVIPEGVTAIYRYAFACNDSYTYAYDANGNYMYDENGDVIYYYYFAKLISVSLPSTLRTLGDYAFGYQRNLKSVSFADGLTSIPSYAFYYCSKLANLLLPTTLQTVGSYAFYGCSSVKRVELPNGVTTISNNAFSSCTNMEEVVLPTTLTSLNSSFSYCNKLTRMTCKAIVPPSTNNYNILGGKESQCTLIVPNLTINTYKQTAYWDQFNIVGAGILPQNIIITQNCRLSWNDVISKHLPDSIFGNDIVSNGDMEGTDVSCYMTQIRNDNGVYNMITPSIVDGIGVNGSHAIMVEANPITDSSYEWDAQFFVTLPYSLPTGTKYHVEFDYRATNECDVPTQSHADPANYIYWQMIPTVHFTNEWQHYDYVGEITSQQSTDDKWMQSIAFNLTVNADTTQFFFDNVKFVVESFNYKPAVRIENSGRLELTGNNTLSASSFAMVYDENLDYQYNYGRRSSGASAISAALINKANIRADEVFIDLWTRANTWTFFSLPFDAKVSEIGEQNPGTPFAIRKYDGQKRANSEMSSTWVNMTADSILHAGEGYIIQSPNRGNNYYNGFWFKALQNINKNNIFANDNVEVELVEYQSEFPQNRSWNLVGNPYPCYYDTRAIDVTAPITVWNAYNNNYQAYSPVDDQLILRPGEAFFIQRPVDQASITFLKEGRQTNYDVRNVSYFNNTRQNDWNSNRSVFNLILSDGEQSDRTRFVINSQAQMGYEMEHDASKFMSTDASVQIYTVEQGLRYSINERPLSTGEITIGVTFVKQGSYTITLSTTVNNEVWLIDHLTGTEVLLGEDGYTFETEAGTYEKRFAIRLGNGELTGIKSIADDQQNVEKYYDLRGVSVQQPKKGLYINNGKKVVVQ